MKKKSRYFFEHPKGRNWILFELKPYNRDESQYRYTSQSDPMNNWTPWFVCSNKDPLRWHKHGLKEITEEQAFLYLL